MRRAAMLLPTLFIATSQLAGDHGASLTRYAAALREAERSAVDEVADPGHALSTLLVRIVPPGPALAAHARLVAAARKVDRVDHDAGQPEVMQQVVVLARDEYRTARTAALKAAWSAEV